MVVSPISSQIGLCTAIDLALLVLRHDARRLDHFHVVPRAAVGDGRLVGVQFHDRVVNAPPGKRGQDVLDGWIFTLPCASVVERVVAPTFSTRASISGLPSKSTRRKRTPVLGGAGRNVMFTRLPLCRPMPEKLADCRRVCWCNTAELNQIRPPLGKRLSQRRLSRLQVSVKRAY